MSFSVQFQIDLAAIPDEPRREIESTMQQIAEVVTTVPASSPFWSSMKNSVLQIDVAGRRIGYRVDRVRRVILVIEAQELRR